MADAITVKVLSDVKDLTRGMRRGERDVSSFASRAGSKLKRVGSIAAKAGKVIAFGLGAGLVVAAGAGIKFAQAAAEDEQAATLMATAFRNSAGATDKQIAATEKWITKVGKATGVADDDLRPALSRLVTATGDIDKAQRLAALAMDVSAGSGKSLESVSAALAKAQTGQISGLSRLGIATKDAAGNTLTLAQVTDQMQKKFGGAAAQKANTLSGKLARLKLILSETAENIGGFLIPKLTDLADWLLNKVGPALAPVVKRAGVLAKLGWSKLKDAASFLKRIFEAVRDSSKFQAFVRKAGELTALGWGKLKAGRDAVVGIFENGKKAADQLGKIKRRVDAIDFSNLDAKQVGELVGTAVAKGLDAVVSLAGKLTSTLGKMFAKVDWVGLGIAMGRQVPALLIGLAAGILDFDLGGLLGGLAAHWQTILIGILTLAFAPAKIAGGLAKILTRIPFVGTFLGRALLWLNEIGSKFTGFLGRMFSRAWQGFTSVVRIPGAGIVTKVLGALKALPGRVKSFFSDLATRLFVFADDAALAIGRGMGRGLVGTLRFVASIPGRILSALGNLARLLFPKGTAVVEGLWNGLKGRVGAVFGWVKALPGRVVTAVGNVARLLYDKGLNLIAGLIQGLVDKAEELYAKARGIADKVVGILKDAWKIFSPSRVTRGLGEQLMAGLTVGITAGASKVGVKLKSIAKDLIDQARAGFVEVTIGAAEQAVLDAAGRIKDTVQKATDQQHQAAERAYEREYQARKKALEKTYDGKDLKRRLAALEKEHDAHVAALDKLYERLTKKRLRQLGDEIGAVRKAARAYDDTRASLDEWTQTLADRQQVFADHVQAIRDMVTAYADVTQLGQRALGDGTVTSAAGIVEDLQAKLLKIQQFTQQIAQLTALGLDQTSLQQILAAGVDAGSETAAAILAGGPAAVQAVAALQGQIDAAATALGEQTGATFYQQGITQAQQMVAGLKTQLAADQTTLEAAMRELGKAAANGIRKGIKDKDGETRQAIRDMADGMKAELLKAWGIKSPSRVFRTIGGQVVAGLTLGLDSSQVKQSGVRLADALAAGFGTPTIGARLNPVEALDVASTFAASQRIEIHLTAEQLSALARGRAIEADRKVFLTAGGRPAS